MVCLLSKLRPALHYPWWIASRHLHRLRLNHECDQLHRNQANRQISCLYWYVIGKTTQQIIPNDTDIIIYLLKLQFLKNRDFK
jgi:hypothetical protein